MAATLIGFTPIGTDLRAQTPGRAVLPALWESAFAARGGAGYKDNVFLSHARAQGSGFASAGGDITALRIAPLGPLFNFFASADANHYFSTTPALDEYLVSAQGQVEQDLGAGLTGWLATDYFYQDQVVDVAFLDPASFGTNLTVFAAPVRGHTITLRPGISVDLSRRWLLALEVPMSRQYYEQPLDDYWKTGGKLTLGYSYGYTSQLSLSYEPAWRSYDTDRALTATGAPIAGTPRQRFEQDVNLAWRHHWDAAKRWRTLAKLGGRLSKENGDGFADYAQWSASTQVQYRARPWELAVEGRIRTYQYETQTVSATDLSKRGRTEWSATIRLERELSHHLRLIASYEHEHTLSNDPLETYQVNTVSGSLQWEF